LIKNILIGTRSVWYRNVRMMVDVESGMHQFDTVVEPHFRFSANTRHCQYAARAIVDLTIGLSCQINVYFVAITSI